MESAQNATKGIVYRQASVLFLSWKILIVKLWKEISVFSAIMGTIIICINNYAKELILSAKHPTKIMGIVRVVTLGTPSTMVTVWCSWETLTAKTSTLTNSVLYVLQGIGCIKVGSAHLLVRCATIMMPPLEDVLHAIPAMLSVVINVCREAVRILIVRCSAGGVVLSAFLVIWWLVGSANKPTPYVEHSACKQANAPAAMQDTHWWMGIVMWGRQKILIVNNFLTPTVVSVSSAMEDTWQLVGAVLFRTLCAKTPTKRMEVVLVAGLGMC